MDYYWSADESEWASDVMFNKASALAAVYPGLVKHAMLNLSSRNIMRFLGRKDPYQGGYGAFKGEVISDLKQRPEGTRVKHRVNENSIKMYDKQGSVLRVETTINNIRDFKVYRTADGEESINQDVKRKAKPKWRPMRKGVSDMHRRGQVCQAANERYLDAMATVQQHTPLKAMAQPLCGPVKWKGRQSRGLNPLSRQDAQLLEHVARGEFILNGLRNRDLRNLMFKPATDDIQARRQSGQITRKLRLLRAHGLIQKVPRTHRYIVSPQGRQAITALLTVQDVDIAKLTAA
jgi:hypothetical protein